VDSQSVGRKQHVSLSRKTFEKGDRLLHRPAFIRLSTNGKRYCNQHFIVYFIKNNYNHCRLGITVTRKVGKAAKRNRIKRLAREYFRQNRHIFSENWDISLIAKKQCADIPNNTVFSSLENIFDRIATYKGR
jgi:ribonuclease P protein component